MTLCIKVGLIAAVLSTPAYAEPPAKLWELLAHGFEIAAADSGILFVHKDADWRFCLVILSNATVRELRNGLVPTTTPPNTACFPVSVLN